MFTEKIRRAGKICYFYMALNHIIAHYHRFLPYSRMTSGLQTATFKQPHLTQHIYNYLHSLDSPASHYWCSAKWYHCIKVNYRKGNYNQLKR